MKPLYYVSHPQEAHNLADGEGEYFEDFDMALENAQQYSGKSIIWKKVGRVRTNRPDNLPDMVEVDDAY